MNSKNKTILVLSIFIVIVSLGMIACTSKQEEENTIFLTYKVDPESQKLNFYWKDSTGKSFHNIHNLRAQIESENLKLVFAMNGGMYKPDYSPQGLYIEKQKILNPLDTLEGEGNFYLKPNGVFYLTINNLPVICKTEDFKSNRQIQYATQSGPILLFDGEINPVFDKTSNNLNIRNGVGILPDNQVVFVLSKEKINLYNFANYFKKLGCKRALYLDGFVSRAYLPEKNWKQTDGNFGVIIGVVEDKH